MTARENLPRYVSAETQYFSRLADNTSNTILNDAIKNDEPGVGLLERAEGNYRFLSSEVVGEPVREVVTRIKSGSAEIYRAYAFVDHWLECHYDLNTAPPATSESILETATELGELAKIESDFMIESSEQVRPIVQEMLDASPDPGSWVMRARAEEAFSYELEALTGSNLERRARLSEMMLLSDQIRPVMPEHIVEAVLTRLRSTPKGLQQMQRLQDAALLQQNYEHYVSLFQEVVARNPRLVPLQPLKAVARGLASVVTLPNGRVAPRDPIFRKNCPSVAQNYKRVDSLFLDNLLGEGANLVMITPYKEIPPAYQSFRSARQTMLASAGFAMTRILDTFVEQTRP